MVRGKGLIREDSCNLCKERGMGPRAQKALSQEFVSPGARLVFQRHSARASLCIWFLERRGTSLISRRVSRRTLISMFHETFITS